MVWGGSKNSWRSRLCFQTDLMPYDGSGYSWGSGSIDRWGSTEGPDIIWVILAEPQTGATQADEGRCFSGTLSVPVSPGSAALAGNGPTGLLPDQEPTSGTDLQTECNKRKSSESLSCVGMTIGCCGSLLLDRLLEVLPLRSKSTGGRDKISLFPLPTSRSKLRQRYPNSSDEEVNWMICVCVSLNSMWGSEVFFDGEWNKVGSMCMDRIHKEVLRFVRMPTVVPPLEWADLFQVRSIDYKGEEVRVARWFSWGNIGPALPAEVGKVPLEDVCTLGCKHYVQHFDQYLKPESEWGPIPRPRVMVSDEDWGMVCKGLVETGICVYLEEDEVFHAGEMPLLNGLFGVTKEEYTESGVEIFRLIMNLIPLNGLCRPMTGDVDTLPSWGSMSPFFLQPTENLLVSSEDVKCFFYTMSVPPSWIKFLAFNKLVPNEVLPETLKDRRVYVACKVLPMGFLNSVSLAQHVRRNLVAWGGSETGGVNPPEEELRKDRPHTVAPVNWRVYLDNYDLLEKVSATEMVDLEGTCAPGVLSLRHEYEVWGVPRNIKKAVSRSSKCEVQGATVDGVEGIAYPREAKLGKYFGLCFDLCLQERARQKQWRVACGGLVHFSMFRRPLLGSLNRVWTHIESYNHVRGTQVSPKDCKLEVLRFLGLLPLGRLDFRLDMREIATCSDASTKGGGACASTGLTPVGEMVCEGRLRGEIPENRGEFSIFCVGLFDGISALRVALDVLGVSVLGHVSVDKHQPARRVVESHFPGTIFVDKVEDVTFEMVQQWRTQFSQASLVLLGAGPPCQGVSGLNCDRRGALLDERSNLFTHVPRIRGYLKQCFTWCPVESLIESVASMDASDREAMSEAFEAEPLECDAGDYSWCRRPRLYWVTWEIPEDDNYIWDKVDSKVPQLHLQGNQSLEAVLRPGWIKVDPTRSFPTFTTSRPSQRPGRKPAGIQQCSDEELSRWSQDQHRFPPYQYKTDNCVVNSTNKVRVPDVAERELMLGFPLNYTEPCVAKSQRNSVEHSDVRLTLLGNTWSVPVVASLLQPLFATLGFIAGLTPQDVLDACVPGIHETVQGRLVRLPIQSQRLTQGRDPKILNAQLGNLISIKGEDIMLTTPTSQMVKFHRLRASVPGRLWKWKVIAGWKWKLGSEHINSLELRAIFTTLRWRVEHRLHSNCRLIHLTDSLVCLHALTRGRSSSRKLRRTMSRINALVLAANLQPVWGYIHTDQNPADRPSRWGQRVKTRCRHAKKTRAWSHAARGPGSTKATFRDSETTHCPTSNTAKVWFGNQFFSTFFGKWKFGASPKSFRWTPFFVIILSISGPVAQAAPKPAIQWQDCRTSSPTFVTTFRERGVSWRRGRSMRSHAELLRCLSIWSRQWPAGPFSRGITPLVSLWLWASIACCEPENSWGYGALTSWPRHGTHRF